MIKYKYVVLKLNLKRLHAFIFQCVFPQNFKSLHSKFPIQVLYLGLSQAHRSDASENSMLE